MEYRLCQFIFSILCFFSTNLFAGECDKSYIEWMGGLIQKEKQQSQHEFAGIIPTSLVLGQSILETGYGKALLAKKRNNFFGLRDKGRLIDFQTPEKGISFYFKNLSENLAYSKLRKKLEKGISNPFVLLKVLAPVYAEDENYESKVKVIINTCNLKQLDYV